MKRGKILIWVLAGVITTGLLISSFISYKNTNKYGGELYILSNNAAEDSENNKIKVIKEHDFKLEEGLYDYESLLVRDEKLYLESRNRDGKLLKTEEIIFEGNNSKRVEVEKLKEAPNLRDIEFILDNCEFEDLGNGNWKVFSKDYGKEEIVNIEKFNKNNFAEETLKESEEYYVLEDCLIFFMKRRFDLGEGIWDKDGDYKEIRWYDFNNELWDSIEVPKEVYLDGTLIGVVDNKVFILGNSMKGEQFSSKIYSLDLKEKVLKDEVDLLEKGEVYYDLAFLNDEKILFHCGSSEGEKVKMIDLRNKVTTELYKSNLDVERFFLSQKVAPSGDKIFYLSQNGGNMEVKALKIGNNKTIAEGKVYDYEYNKAALIKEYGEDYIDPTPQILWSNDGKYLIIGEKEKGSIKISNIKVLELSQ
ncbi:hypothetical protein ELS18_02880 [Clostridium perfringens]|uniref:hypothetical protein n=1 Tax=Clostridium perfringens TaxID=1502 RepID=UPI000F8C5DD0|nr:hypothetical protein [Clostridium perfringens]RUR41980.1 hypothetical protein ELS18_02880 [Clostridium perfringens]